MGKIQKRAKFTKTWGFACTQQQVLQLVQKGIKPEHFRSFIENFGKEEGNGIKKIKSSDWKELKAIIERTPSLFVAGNVGSGKSFLLKELVKNDTDHIYIVLDAHKEFEFLPEINTITPNLKESSRIRLPDQPNAAVAMFSVYHNLIMNGTFPKNFVLVIEEALRYQESGIKNLLAEARKWLYVIAVSQEIFVDYIPAIKVIPYTNYKP